MCQNEIYNKVDLLFRILPCVRYHTARSLFVMIIPRCIIFSHIANLYRKVLGKEETPAQTPNVQKAETTPSSEKKSRPTTETGMKRRILNRNEHAISRSMISDNALKVLYRLNKAGYQAYLVGGGVRDLLLGKIPKDFDVVTDAHPEQIKKLFNNCRLIGRRFRLAHIVFGRDIIEVATFRGHHHQVNTSKHSKQIAEQSEEGMLLRDNVYGTIDEDAERRDFTVNALYYNIKDFTLHDFHGGLNDLADGKLELIGDPETRYREDPVRMLRAVRFSAKLGLKISDRSATPIHELAPLLQDIPAARLFEETIKLFLAGHAVETYHQLREFGLFQQLFPQVARLLTESKNSPFERFLEKALYNSDKRVVADLPVTPTFFYATLLWGIVSFRQKELSNETNLPFQDTIQMAINEAIESQIKTVAIPRRITSDIREIWLLQERLPRYSGKRAEKLFAQPKFRAAFDFIELRAAVEPRLKDVVTWWQEYQQTHDFVRPEPRRAPAPGMHAESANKPAEDKTHRKRPRRRRRYPQQSSGQRRHD